MPPRPLARTVPAGAPTPTLLFGSQAGDPGQNRRRHDRQEPCHRREQRDAPAEAGADGVAERRQQRPQPDHHQRQDRKQE